MVHWDKRFSLDILKVKVTQLSPNGKWVESLIWYRMYNSLSEITIRRRVILSISLCLCLHLTKFQNALNHPKAGTRELRYFKATVNTEKRDRSIRCVTFCVISSRIFLLVLSAWFEVQTSSSSRRYAHKLFIQLKMKISFSHRVEIYVFLFFLYSVIWVETPMGSLKSYFFVNSHNFIAVPHSIGDDVAECCPLKAFSRSISDYSPQKYC